MGACARSMGQRLSNDLKDGPEHIIRIRFWIRFMFPSTSRTRAPYIHRSTMSSVVPTSDRSSSVSSNNQRHDPCATPLWDGNCACVTVCLLPNIDCGRPHHRQRTHQNHALRYAAVASPAKLRPRKLQKERNPAQIQTVGIAPHQNTNRQTTATASPNLTGKLGGPSWRPKR